MTDMRKKHRDRIAWAVALVSALMLAVLRLPGALTKILIARGADGATCIFSQDIVGFETTMPCYVLRNGQSLFVGYAENSSVGVAYPYVRWSRNKRLVVIENNRGLYLAYDFTRQQAIDKDSREIKSRLKQNGGYGEAIFGGEDSFAQESHHPWLWEMKYIPYP